jgi:hypothetical protein
LDQVNASKSTTVLPIKDLKFYSFRFESVNKTDQVKSHGMHGENDWDPQP